MRSRTSPVGQWERTLRKALRIPRFRRFPFSPPAAEWWTGYAPDEELTWFGKQWEPSRVSVSRLHSSLRALDRSKNDRFRYEPKLRKALLEPLLDHPDEGIRDRVRKLIERGPTY